MQSQVECVLKLLLDSPPLGKAPRPHGERLQMHFRRFRAQRASLVFPLSALSSSTPSGVGTALAHIGRCTTSPLFIDRGDGQQVRYLLIMTSPTLNQWRTRTVATPVYVQHNTGTNSGTSSG
eukprot:818395-Rhodomonas_salina.1